VQAVNSPLSSASSSAPQRIIKVRRDYNAWVASETMEDYALRFTPQRFRQWSAWRVANTALGGASSFLILEAVGATLLVQYGFVNAFWAILATGVLIFLAGLPISVYAARYGVDMDLLTRGAGFGYIGSTITSLIYASFTFIFFALEAAVMAYALELAFDIPPAWGYLVCALVVIPLVTHGVTAIGRLQAWTLPLWIVLLVAPFVAVLHAHPGLVAGLVAYPGAAGTHGGFEWLAFGAATTVGIALITQMGEQADYLRFMPERTAANRGRWWAGVLIGGPDRAVRAGVAGEDQPDQCLCRLARLVELLRAPDAPSSGTRGVGGVQRADRAAADGNRRVLGAEGSADAVFDGSDRMDRRAGVRSGDQQAARPVAEAYRVQARSSV